MLRRLALVVAAMGITACSNCDHPCREGITFNVAEIAGALSRGSEAPLHVCLDDSCHDVTVTRDNVGGNVFLQFKGVANAGDHHLTLSGSGLNGDYSGPVYSYQQDPGSSCSACAFATVKLGADGTITPAVPAPSAVTTTLPAP